MSEDGTGTETPFKARPTNVPVPTPPRQTGIDANDIKALFSWVNEFTNAVVQATGLVDPAYQASGASTVDIDNPPSPTQTTIARAQETANQSVTRARSDLNKRVYQTGTVTVLNGSDTVSVPFTTPRTDTKYVVVPQFSATTGSPSIDSYHFVRVTKGQSNFVIEINAVLTGGSTLGIDYAVLENTTAEE